MTQPDESRRSPSGEGYSPRLSEEGVSGCLRSSGSGVRIPPGAPSFSWFSEWLLFLQGAGLQIPANPSC